MIAFALTVAFLALVLLVSTLGITHVERVIPTFISGVDPGSINVTDCLENLVGCQTDADCVKRCRRAVAGERMICDTSVPNAAGYPGICRESGVSENCNAQNGGLSVFEAGEAEGLNHFGCLCSFNDFYGGTSCGSLNADVCANGTFQPTQAPVDAKCPQSGCKTNCLSKNDTKCSRKVILPPTSRNCTCNNGYTRYKRNGTSGTPICVPDGRDFAPNASSNTGFTTPLKNVFYGADRDFPDILPDESVEPDSVEARSKKPFKFSATLSQKTCKGSGYVEKLVESLDACSDLCHSEFQGQCTAFSFRQTGVGTSNCRISALCATNNQHDPDWGLYLPPQQKCICASTYKGLVYQVGDPYEGPECGFGNGDDITLKPPLPASKLPTSVVNRCKRCWGEGDFRNFYGSMTGDAGYIYGQWINFRNGLCTKACKSVKLKDDPYKQNGCYGQVGKTCQYSRSFRPNPFGGPGYFVPSLPASCKPPPKLKV